jgi:hypothetical protein
MEQPFYVGQKIIRIAETVPGIVEKGEIYTCHAMAQCGCKIKWHVYIEEVPAIGRYCTCPNCGQSLPKLRRRPGYAFEFAPLPPAYENISAELAKDAVPETSDIILKPIPVTN